jgi:hypothetical protein
LVAGYLAALDTDVAQDAESVQLEEMPPITASLWGILANKTTMPQLDEEDYRAYLEQKHG